MGKRIDLIGQRFGRLTVISLNEEISKQKRHSYWNCKCDCGNEKVVWGADLKRGRTNSCGCYNRQMQSDKMKERWQDEEYRQMKSDKMRELNEKRWQDEEFRQMKSNEMREMAKERWQDEEFRQMQSDKMKERWQDEEFRQIQSEIHSKINGENSSNWKGGITPISIYLRHLLIVKQWFNDSKKQANYTCELTGKVGYKLNTHHLKAFNTIVLEAHELHNIQIHEIIGEYTKEELHKLEEYVVSWHKDSSNAVVLSEEVHDLFHSLYGKGNNTKEQFEEFKERYLNGEFNDLLGGDLND